MSGRDERTFGTLAEGEEQQILVRRVPGGWIVDTRWPYHREAVCRSRDELFSLLRGLVAPDAPPEAS